MLIRAVTKYAFKRSRRLRLENGTSPPIAPSVITWFYMALTVGSCLRNKRTVFPGGATEKNPPADAGNSGPTPGLGWSHRPEQLSPCATPAEAAVWRPGGKLLKPVCLQPVLYGQRRNHSGKPKHKLEKAWKPACSNEDPVQPKIKYKF